jgi:predicted MFS family arabinose efflux permease
MALFIGSSTVCGLALDPAVLIAGRFVQGAAAALISPSVHDQQVAVLAEAREHRSVLVLRSALHDGQHHGPDALGTRALFW